jgi:DNA-binding NarL/FixJ family response regulator
MNSTQNLRNSSFLLVDDHTLFRTGLRLVLQDCLGLTQIHEAGAIMDAVDKYTGQRFDLILLDVQLPGLNGLDGAKVLMEHFPDARILVVSGSSEQAGMQAARVPGVSGFVAKSAAPADIEAAIHNCLNGIRHFPDNTPAPGAGDGRSGLTPRQRDVLDQLALGRSNKLIARHLGVAENTVRVHVAAILDYLGVDNRLEAVLEAQRLGLVRSPA